MNKKQKEVQQALLNSEKKTIKELKQVYKQALKDCEIKIMQLSARADMNPDNLQSIIYQKNYQEVIKAQIEGVLSNLQSDSYAKVSEYITDSYQNGYIGTMYDIAGQGIPLIIPIDQNQVIKAINTDSKLSKSLYEKMGEDVNSLKKAIRTELSRGIANGSTWNDIALKISSHNMDSTIDLFGFNKAYNNSLRIARTEGHRVQIQATMDAQQKAKESGADIVKQWDSTLDGKVRASHRMLDGQIREIDEDFEVGGRNVSAPGMFGNPAEDCNCRCALLQRARWALDDDELQTLRERAAYHGVNVKDSKEFGHEKAKDFSDYKNKYLKALDQVRSNVQKINDAVAKEASLRTKGNGDYGVNWKTVKTKEYTNRFNSLSNNEKANNLAAQRSRNALVNRSGKTTEELYAISLTKGTDVSSITNQHIEFGVKRTDKFMADVKRAEENGESILFIHNHPRGLPPSITDLNELINHKNAVGITVGHNGSIYYYTKPDRKIETIDEVVAIRKNKKYNGVELEEKAIEELSKQFSFEFRKL